VVQRGFPGVHEIDFFLRRKMAPHQLLTSVIARCVVFALGAGCTATWRSRGGDPLWKVADTFGVSVSTLRAANGLQSDVIKSAQVLNLS
jgi:hypothetical protein